MKDILIGYGVGSIVTLCMCYNAFTREDSYLLGQEVQKVINVCEEKLPRNEKCTFLIVPENKLIYDEEKER